jgi:hypothetical protein
MSKRLVTLEVRPDEWDWLTATERRIGGLAPEQQVGTALHAWRFHLAERWGLLFPGQSLPPSLLEQSPDLARRVNLVVYHGTMPELN